MKNKSIQQALLFAALFSMFACGPSIKVTESWMNQELTGKEKYQKVFIFTLSNRLDVRKSVEDAFANTINKQGDITVIRGYEVFPPDFLNGKPEKAAVLQQIQATGADVLLITALIDSKEETRHVPGTTNYYTPYPAYPHYGAFGSYYGYHSSYMYDPGYYVEDQTYFLESNFYDLRTEEIIWSAQSEILNPNNLDKVADKYSKELIERLKKDGSLRRKGS